MVAETLESQFAETAESQSDILALHCTEAGLIEKAAGTRQDSGHWCARRWSKPWPSSLVPSIRSRPCPARRRGDPGTRLQPFRRGSAASASTRARPARTANDFSYHRCGRA
jgi:hypothetical protein